ncbi:MAG: orotidine-5'-phosphate decarboxylase [Candidatus Omnitrophica bacterium]|nr:orotidine-5'-phosphate decarboxylase [Candidatus Omnitrophota bacterium]
MAEIIFALDFNDLDRARDQVRLLKKEINFFKIGLQLFTLYGPKAVEMVKKEGGNVFLDLKLHDIPQTCALATKAAASLGCYSITIHIEAGNEALKLSKEAQIDGFPHLWGVTILSSISQGDSVARAQQADSSRLEGVIVSGKDVQNITNNFSNFEIVVPGIRPVEYSKTDDQKRVLTPAEAVNRGADFLVIGRPIREAKDPLETVKKIKQSIQ